MNISHVKVTRSEFVFEMSPDEVINELKVSVYQYVVQVKASQLDEMESPQQAEADQNTSSEWLDYG